MRNEAKFAQIDPKLLKMEIKWDKNVPKSMKMDPKCVKMAKSGQNEFKVVFGPKRLRTKMY